MSLDVLLCNISALQHIYKLPYVEWHLSKSLKWAQVGWNIKKAKGAKGKYSLLNQKWNLTF